MALLKIASCDGNPVPYRSLVTQLQDGSVHLETSGLYFSMLKPNGWLPEVAAIGERPSIVDRGRYITEGRLAFVAVTRASQPDRPSSASLIGNRPSRGNFPTT